MSESKLKRGFHMVDIKSRSGFAESMTRVLALIDNAPGGELTTEPQIISTDKGARLIAGVFYRVERDSADELTEALTMAAVNLKAHGSHARKRDAEEYAVVRAERDAAQKIKKDRMDDRAADTSVAGVNAANTDGGGAPAAEGDAEAAAS